MAVPLAVLGRALRISLVRFKSLAAGTITAARPLLDDRAYASTGHGPTVGGTVGSTIEVGLERVRVANSDALFVVSKSPRVVSVVSPKHGAVPKGAGLSTIKLACEADGKALIEVRWGKDAESGVVIARMQVRSLAPKRLAITPFVVAISNATEEFVESTMSEAAITAAVERVNATYAPLGIVFKRNRTRKLKFGSVTPEFQIDDGHFLPVTGDANEMLDIGFDPRAINVYFVRAISLPILDETPAKIAHTFGLGFAKSVAREKDMKHPFIVMGDRAIERATVTVSNNTVSVADIAYRARDAADGLANDMAHEIGHFLGLEHVERLNVADALQATWSRQRLMHPTNPLRAYNDFRDDVGFGKQGRGHLLTMWHLEPMRTDDECKRARDTIDAERSRIYDF